MNWRAPDNSAAHPSKSDAELVLAARQGDKKAFVEIVVRHQAMVCGIALSILGDFAASEDAGQEAFLTAWRKLGDLREPDRLKSWLAQIARNAALGQFRRKHGHEPLPDEIDIADESPAPDEAAASEEENALVRQSLAKLPETYRLALILFYREGNSVKAVAEALDISEDAVKQRLARGRELLRDRMSGVVETALTRTRPNAVFTMLIAAAIGALAAPSAMAATAFAAGAATGGAATTTTSSSLFTTVMTTSKGLVAATAIVAAICIPIGYQLNSAPAASAATAPAATSAATEVVLITNAAPSFADSALFAEWRALHDKYGTNAAAMPELHKAIGGMTNSFRRLAFRAALVSEWAQVDPKGGFNFLLGKDGDATQRKQFFDEWLARDPKAATAALLAADKGWEGLARSCLSEIARRDPASVIPLAERLSKSDSYWDTSVRDAIAIMAESELPSVRQAVEKMTGANREQALSGIAIAWAKSDLNGAVAWAKSLPNGTDRDEIVRAALIGGAKVDPVAALNLIGTVPPGGRQGYFADTTGARVLAEAAEANFDATVAWVAAHPGNVGREDMFGLAKTVTERLNADPVGFLNDHSSPETLSAIMRAMDSALMNGSAQQRPAVWEWLKTQPDNTVTRQLHENVIGSAAGQDPQLALQFAADLGSAPDADAIRKSVAHRLFNGGYTLFRYDEYMTAAPETMRQPIINSAIELLGSNNLDDAQRWVSRIAQMPEASRADATAALARAWGDLAPQAAANWAATLPASTRTSVEGAIVQPWARKDPYAAAAWTETLTPGPEKDNTTLLLVSATASKYPREAWDWSMSISDPTQRDRAAQQAVAFLAAKDPAMARQLIEASPMDPSLKEQLLLSLQKTPSPSACK